MFNYEDREKVRELFARFCHSIDEGRYEEWVGTFTPDGVFDSPVVGPPRRTRGPAEIHSRPGGEQHGRRSNSVIWSPTSS